MFAHGGAVTGDDYTILEFSTGHCLSPSYPPMASFMWLVPLMTIGFLFITKPIRLREAIWLRLGGNELYGGAGADTLEGGSGTDYSERDRADDESGVESAIIG